MKKEDKERKELANTYDSFGLTYEDYREHCECNEVEPKEEGSPDYYEWLSETTCMYWQDFLDNLRYGKCDYPVMITGTLGLWNGSPSVCPVLMTSEDWVTHYTNREGERVPYEHPHYEKPSLMRAIVKCFGKCDDIKVHYDNGVIEVSAMHHDGTNTFSIRKLSKKGLKAVEAADNRCEDYKPKPWWFSRIAYADICG